MTAFRPPMLAVIFAFPALFGACGELDDILGETDISGTVHDQSYSFISGTAESSVTGGYMLTLADDPDFSCASTPSGSYLTIVVQGIDSPGSVSASGNVTFNFIDDGANHTESATSGSVHIDTVDPDDLKLIQGEIDAAGNESEVFGGFSVPICG